LQVSIGRRPREERIVHRFGFDPRTLSPEIPITFSGPEGALEGLWRPVRPGAETRGMAVVAHPHPAFGGSMMNKVVFHTARVLNHDLDLAALRFNFRGVGKSAGRYDEGRGEVDDVLAAWSEARRRAPEELPLVAAGFSFGSGMTLAAVARPGAPVPAALVLIGLPIRLFTPPTHIPSSLPLVAVHGEEDQFTPPEAVGAYLEGWPGPHAFHVVGGADHFLEDHLPEATAFVSRSLREWL
jgi:alpha/beta superfamily hydrolase